ncbi:MAG: PepSY domain-containing protein [Symploca sp. SIO3C6]|nr:PepSY domain-containing protein [Symploca sp. SIO3C6]NET03660.1 PepSY domain-containing protein [Symploca sp. SIO2B6]
MERETEEGKPVIEVAMGGQEIFVDAETGEIVAIDNLYEKGDPEDLEEINEFLKLQKYGVIPIQEALEAAESFAGGQAHTVELENEDGNLVYEVVIGLQEVYVDAGNGKVLFSETISTVNKSDDSQFKSSIQVP